MNCDDDNEESVGPALIYFAGLCWLIVLAGVIRAAFFGG
jgi:hypothetical protein